MLVHASNLITQEAESSGPLSSRLAYSTERNPVSQNEKTKTKKKNYFLCVIYFQKMFYLYTCFIYLHTWVACKIS